MTILWTPDSCLCEIEIDDLSNYVSWYNKCEFHKNINDNALLNVVLVHNRNFNRRFSNPNSSEKKLMIQDKRAEKLRIKAMGNGTRRATA